MTSYTSHISPCFSILTFTPISRTPSSRLMLIEKGKSCIEKTARSNFEAKTSIIPQCDGLLQFLDSLIRAWRSQARGRVRMMVSRAVGQ